MPDLCRWAAALRVPFVPFMRRRRGGHRRPHSPPPALLAVGGGQRQRGAPLVRRRRLAHFAPDPGDVGGVGDAQCGHGAAHRLLGCLQPAPCVGMDGGARLDLGVAPARRMRHARKRERRNGQTDPGENGPCDERRRDGDERASTIAVARARLDYPLTKQTVKKIYVSFAFRKVAHP